MVNDPGVAIDGSGRDSSLAQRVVDEIIAAGGEAVAHTDSVADWEGAGRLIHRAVEAFGDLHIVVNNAGILPNELLLPSPSRADLASFTEQMTDLVLHCLAGKAP